MSEHAPGPWRAYRLNAQEVDVICDVTGEYGTFLGINAGSGAPDSLEPDDQRRFDAHVQLVLSIPETARLLAELVAAAEPFMAFAGLPSFDKLPDDFVITAGSRMAAPQLTAGDLRRLAEAVAATKAKGE